MCVCIYVCVKIVMYTGVHVYIHMYDRTSVRMCVYVYMNENVHVQMFKSIYAYD